MTTDHYFPLPNPDNEPLGELRDDDGNVATLVIVDDAITNGKTFRIFATVDTKATVVGVSHTALERLWRSSDDHEASMGVVFSSVARSLTRHTDPRG